MGLKVLSALDSAKTQYYHYKAIVIAGMGLFTDSYDLFCFPPILKLIGRIYYKDEPTQFQVKALVASTMIGVPLLGTIVGQLVFGSLGDHVGRRRVYGMALTIMVLSSLGCGFSICRERACVLASLCFFRFMLGVGIGGDYPLSATIMSEFANKKTRGAFIAAVFSMQGFGILFSSSVTVVVCALFDAATNASPDDPTPMVADLAWRIILMFGAVPAALTYYWRMMMPETARYTALVERNVEQAGKDMEKVLSVPLSQITVDEVLPPTPPSYPLLSKEFVRRHGRDLFSCSSSWFLVDIVFYSSNLFQSYIYTSYIPTTTKLNAFQEAIWVAKIQAAVAACATIPGYFATVFFIDRIGRVNIQLLGFLSMALLYLAIGVPYYSFWDLHILPFMFLYGLSFFFSNFGPNTTTFIVPSEMFPARFRATCHGVAGACGKVGAIIGSVGFLWGSRGMGMTASLVILGGVCVVGMLVTFFFTRETMGISLEENETEHRLHNNDDNGGLLRCVTDCSMRSHSFHASEVAAEREC